MAQLIPNWESISKFNPPLTPGEKALAIHLEESLDNSWEIFIQPHMNGDKPDFILMSEGRGVIIIEVKDWDLIKCYKWVKINNTGKYIMEVRDQNGKWQKISNPFQQVNTYKERLFNLYTPELAILLRKNKKAFSLIKCCLFFSEVSIKHLIDFFGTNRIKFVDIIGKDDLISNRLKNKIDEFHPKQSFFWDESIGNRLRNILSPPLHKIEDGRSINLSIEQREHAKPNPGFHRVRGVAGSGKSLVLAFRAAELASQGFAVLITYFNITLGNYLHDMVSWYRGKFPWTNFEFKHFHMFCLDRLRESDIPEDLPGDKASNEEMNIYFKEILPSKVLMGIKMKKIKYPKYDAILIDEGQDFYENYFEVLQKFLNERKEVLIVVDDKQNIYNIDGRWVDNRMSGFKGAWGLLSSSYRLPRKILSLANSFSKEYLPNSQLLAEPGHIILNLDMVVWKNFNSINDAASEIGKVIRNTIDSKLRIHPSDIAILVEKETTGQIVLDALKKNNIDYIHAFSREHKHMFWMDTGRVKVVTIHSFKGWELMYVFVIVEDPLKDPKSHDALMYTGFTRSRGNLVVCNCSKRYEKFGMKFQTEDLLV